jgi:hypothetical protein
MVDGYVSLCLQRLLSEVEATVVSLLLSLDMWCDFISH